MLLNEFLERSAAACPDKEALICGLRRYTYRQIDDAANSLAAALIDMDFRRQQRAIVYLDNSAESIVSLFGILKAGGVFVILDPQVKIKKLEYILRNCGAAALMTDTAHMADIYGVARRVPELKVAVVTDYGPSVAADPGSRMLKILSYDKIMEQYAASHTLPCCIDIDLAGLIYTSGSSGIPKGVMLTHLNMVSAASSITQYLENTSEDVVLDTLPLAFDYGLYQVLMAFKVGGTVVLEKSFTYPQRVMSLIAEERVTGWPIVPTIASILTRLKNLDRNQFPSLRYITSTGQALPSRHVAILHEAFPGVKIYSMYGLTECKRVAYLPPEELETRPGSVGKAMPNTEVFIVDEEGNEITEAWTPGELVVRGANVMKGYWGLPDETARALRPGRYPDERVLHTGDIFQKDEEDFLYFLGRKDDIIKTAGHMVSPKEVENVLCENREVMEAAVIGVDDEIRGKAVMAFVHLAEGSRASVRDIIQFCSERLEDFAVPRSVILCGPLPKTSNGKIQKRDLLAVAS